MCDDKAEQIAFQLFDEAEIGHEQIDAWQIGTSEGQTKINENPFALPLRPEAVQHCIHADLAEPAERH
jgi:hypothetical protein